MTDCSENRGKQLALFNHRMTEPEAAVLRALLLKDTNGVDLFFELKKMRDVSLGSLSVILRRLDHAGFVVNESHSTTDSKGGYKQTIFSVTKKGTLALEQFDRLASSKAESMLEDSLATPPPTPKDELISGGDSNSVLCVNST